MASLVITDRSIVPHAALYITATDEDSFASEFDPDGEIPRPEQGTLEFYYLNDVVYAKDVTGSIHEVEGLIDLQRFVRKGIDARKADASRTIEDARKVFEEVEERCNSNITFYEGFLDAA